MDLLHKIKKPVEQQMRAFDALFSKTVQSDDVYLNNITRYVLRQQGKKIRPMLVLLTASMLDPAKEWDRAVRGAAFVELLHLATLVHDDVVDVSFQRRGIFSVNALWKNKAAVLVGDFLFSRGLSLAVDYDDFSTLKVVNRATTLMSEGELLQMATARKMDFNQEGYFEIIKKKTASFIAACCAAGAVAVEAPEELVQCMTRFGECIGIAFQIKDDLFDYEQELVPGKPTGVDIKEKKITLPLIHLLNSVSLVERRKILVSIKRKEISNERVFEIMEAVRTHGGIEFAKECMEKYKLRALDILKDMPDNDCKEALKMLVEYTVDRKR